VRPVRQQFRHIPSRGLYGDCHRAVLASLFEVDLRDVPHFAGDGPTADRFDARIAVWLAERNLSSVTFPLQGSVSSVLSGVARSCPRGHWLLSGSSKGGIDHMVICEGAAIVHDPGFGVGGLAGPCSDGFFWATFLTPINLTHCRPRLGWHGVSPRSWFERFLSAIGFAT